MSHHPPSSPPPLEIDDSDDDFGDFGNVFDRSAVPDVTQPIKDVAPANDYFGGPPSFSDNDDFGDFGDFPSSSSISKATAMFSPPPLENGMSPESPGFGNFADFRPPATQNDELNNFSDFPASNKAEDSISKASAMFSPPPLENGNSYESSPDFGTFSAFPSSCPVENNVPESSDFGNFSDSSPPKDNSLQDVTSATNDSIVKASDMFSPPTLDNNVESSPDFGGFTNLNQSQADPSPNMFSVCDEGELSPVPCLGDKEDDKEPSTELEMPTVESDEEFGNFDQEPSQPSAAKNDSGKLSDDNDDFGNFDDDKELSEEPFKPSEEPMVPDFSFQFTDSLPTPSPLTAKDPMKSVFTWDSIEDPGDEAEVSKDEVVKSLEDLCLDAVEPVENKLVEESKPISEAEVESELPEKVTSSDAPVENNLVPPQHNLSMLSDDDDFTDFDFSAPLSANVVTSPTDDTPYHVREVTEEERELKQVKTKLDFDESFADEAQAADDFGEFDEPSDPPKVPEVAPASEQPADNSDDEFGNFDTPPSESNERAATPTPTEEAATPPRAKVLSGCFSTDDEFADFDFAAPVTANVVIAEDCAPDNEGQKDDEQNVFDFEDGEPADQPSSSPAEEESPFASFEAPAAPESDDEFGNFDTPPSEPNNEPEPSFDPFNTGEAADSDDGFGDFGNFKQPEPSDPPADDDASFSRPAQESDDEFGNFDTPSAAPREDDGFGKFGEDDDDFGDFDDSPKPFAAFEPTNDDADEFGDFGDDDDDNLGNFDDNDDGFAKFSAPSPKSSTPPSGKTVGQAVQTCYSAPSTDLSSCNEEFENARTLIARIHSCDAYFAVACKVHKLGSFNRLVNTLCLSSSETESSSNKKQQPKTDLDVFSAMTAQLSDSPLQASLIPEDLRTVDTQPAKKPAPSSHHAHILSAYNTSTQSEKLSDKAQTIVELIPNLDYMLSKVLRFPVTDTPS